MNIQPFARNNPTKFGFIVSLAACTAIELFSINTPYGPEAPKDILRFIPVILLSQAARFGVLKLMGAPKDQRVAIARAGAGMIIGMIVSGMVGVAGYGEMPSWHVPRLLNFGEAGNHLVRRADNPETPTALSYRGQTIVLKT